MNNFNEDEFLSDVSDIGWERMQTKKDDIGVLVSYWSNLFSLIIEKHAAVMEMCVSVKCCPWIDKDLRKLR